MNIDIQRVIIVPLNSIDDYGIGGYCLYKHWRYLNLIGLNGLDVIVRGDYRKVPINRWPYSVSYLCESLEVIRWWDKCIRHPDQLGLAVIVVDGIKSLYNIDFTGTTSNQT